MAKTNQGPRPIRLDQFKEQLEEAGLSELQPLEIGKGEYVNIRLGITVNDTDESKAFTEAVHQAIEDEDNREAVLLMLGAQNDRDKAKADLERIEDANGTVGEILLFWVTATRDQQERLGKIKLRRS